MFSIRSKSGLIFTSTAMDDTNGKEIEYKTKTKANKELKQLQEAMPQQELYVHEMNTVGRPSIGVTKRVSLTLPEQLWDWVDQEAKGNRSAYLRQVVTDALGQESEWSNYACFGYTIKSMKELNYTDEQITEVIGKMHYVMDMKSVDEAKDIYTNSSY